MERSNAFTQRLYTQTQTLLRSFKGQPADPALTRFSISVPCFLRFMGVFHMGVNRGLFVCTVY